MQHITKSIQQKEEINNGLELSKLIQRQQISVSLSLLFFSHFQSTSREREGNPRCREGGMEQIWDFVLCSSFLGKIREEEDNK